MSSAALEDFNAHVSHPRVAWRPRTYVRLLRRVLSRVHARRDMAAISDPRLRADIGVALRTDRERLSDLAMGLWPFGS